MSDPKGFRRCDGFVGSIPQAFINRNFPVCPLCGSKDPYWTLKDKIEFTANRVMFRCKDCGGVLSATAMDFSGRTKSTASAVLTTAGAYNALLKKHQGKDVKTQYLRVDDAGTAQLTTALVGKELPMEELQRMAAAFDPGYVPPAPGADPDQPAAGAGQPQVRYAEPQAGGYAPPAEPQVSYAPAAPQTGYVPTAAPQTGYVPAAPQMGYVPTAPQTGYVPAAAPQTGYVPAAAPQTGYATPAEPQVSYAQPAEPQVSYAPPAEPQVSYAQPAEPQVSYAQPAYAAPAGVQPAPAGAARPRKAVVSMVFAIIAASFAALYLVLNLDNVSLVFRYPDLPGYLRTNNILLIPAVLLFLGGGVMMIIGSVKGSRGRTLFGVGVLLAVLLYALRTVIYYIGRSGYLESLGVLEDLGVQFYACVLLTIGVVLAGVGLLTGVKPLKLVGAILILVCFTVLLVCRVVNFLDGRMNDSAVTSLLRYLLFLDAMAFFGVSVLTFPIVKERAA